MKSPIPSIAATLVLAISVPAPAFADTVFRLNVLEGGSAAQNGFATLVATETVVTSAGLAAQGDQWMIVDPATGASLVASLLASDPVRDLALLRVPGLQGESANLALEDGIVGRNVQLMLGQNNRPGVLHSQIQTRDGRPRLRHTALIGAEEFAAPLVNNCGQYLGISQSDRSGVFTRRLQADPEFGFIGPLAQFKDFLAANQVDAVIADSVCLSEAEQLQLAEEAARQQQQELQRLQEEQAALEAERETLRLAQEEAARRNEQLTQDAQTRLDELLAREAELAAALDEIESAEESVSSLEQDVSNLELEVSQREQILATAQREQEQQRQRFLYSIAGSTLAGLLLLALLLWQVRRRRLLAQQSELQIQAEQSKAEQARDALARASATYPDVLLVGQEANGRELRVKLNGNALIRSDQGQVLGRSAQQADYVLNLDHVSRQHLRVKVSDGAIMVEDLGTLNGTAINGRDLVPNIPATLVSGDRMRIGLQEFQVTVLPELPG